MSSGNSGCCPGFSFAEHGVQNRQELPHTGNQGQFFRFPSGNKPLVVMTDFRVPSSGGQGGHVKTMADVTTSSPDGPPTPELDPVRRVCQQSIAVNSCGATHCVASVAIRRRFAAMQGRPPVHSIIRVLPCPSVFIRVHPWFTSSPERVSQGVPLLARPAVLPNIGCKPCYHVQI